MGGVLSEFTSHFPYSRIGVRSLGTQDLDSNARHTERMEQNQGVYSGTVRYTGGQSVKATISQGSGRNQGPKN